MIHITKKSMFHRSVSIFKFNEEHYTLKDAAGQSWPNYIGPKREKAQACLTNPVFTHFSLKVAWSGMFLNKKHFFQTELGSPRCASFVSGGRP